MDAHYTAESICAPKPIGAHRSRFTRESLRIRASRRVCPRPWVSEVGGGVLERRRMEGGASALRHRGQNQMGRESFSSPFSYQLCNALIIRLSVTGRAAFQRGRRDWSCSAHKYGTGVGNPRIVGRGRPAGNVATDDGDRHVRSW